MFIYFNGRNANNYCRTPLIKLWQEFIETKQTHKGDPQFIRSGVTQSLFNKRATCNIGVVCCLGWSNYSCRRTLHSHASPTFHIVCFADSSTENESPPVKL